jgi:O-antigen/teichoic acid export membrane protein
MLSLSLSKLKLTTFVANILLSLGNRAIIMSLGLITSVAVARYLGPDGRGLFSVATLVTNLGIQFGNLGVHAANTYEVAMNPKRLPVLLGNSLTVGLGFGVVLVVIITCVILVFPQLVSIHETLLCLAVAGIPIGIAYLLMQNLLLGLHRVKEFNLIELVGKFAAATLVTLALCAGLRTPAWIAAATLVASLVSFLWCFILLKSGVEKIRLSLSQFYSSMSYGLKGYLAALLAYFQQRILLLLIQQDLGAKEAGFFSVAMTMLDLIYIFPVTVGTILFPKLTALNNYKHRYETMMRVTIVVMLGMFILIGLSYLYSEFIIKLLFGDIFVGSNNYFQLMLPGLLFLSVTCILMNYLASSGMPYVVVYAPLAGSITMIGSYNYLYNHINHQFVAIAYSVGNLITLIITIAYIYSSKKSHE